MAHATASASLIRHILITGQPGLFYFIRSFTFKLIQTNIIIFVRKYKFCYKYRLLAIKPE